MKLDPNVVSLAVVTLGVGYGMLVAGMHKSALEWRKRRRTCPSCGRHIVRGACSCSRA
jgi:hypothetical protein